jgi:hypothetical protein
VFDWLFEGRTSVYLVLIVLGGVVVLQWARVGFPIVQETRTRPPRRRLALLPILLVLIALLAGAYNLLDRLVETRREQITRKLQEMAAAVKARNVDHIFAHVSEQFNVQGMNRAAFRGYVETAIENRWADELVLWGDQFPDDSGGVNFFAKPKGPRLQDTAFGVRGRFVLDSDGQWRLQGFEVFLGLGGDALSLPQVR